MSILGLATWSKKQACDISFCYITFYKILYLYSHIWKNLKAQHILQAFRHAWDKKHHTVSTVRSTNCNININKVCVHMGKCIS